MARKILALAAALTALAACGTPGRQAGAPVSSSAAANTPAISPVGATGAASAILPSGGPVVPSPGYPLLPIYAVPAHPGADSGDDGGLNGKTNAD